VTWKTGTATVLTPLLPSAPSLRQKTRCTCQILLSASFNAIFSTKSPKGATTLFSLETVRMKIVTSPLEDSLSRIISTPARCQASQSSMRKETALQITKLSAQAILARVAAKNAVKALLMTRTVGESGSRSAQ